MRKIIEMNRYDDFFHKATGFDEPFPYQRKLALEGELPELLDIPTGAGKTAAVILAWLWRRRYADENIKKSTPCRLIYCLPMRVLVGQTRDNVIRWLYNLNMLAGEAIFDEKDGKLIEYHPCLGEDSCQDDTRLVEGFAQKHNVSGNRIAVTVLMGGEDREEWDLYPERDAIIIGTQDMLLSRALNRGYGMSRYRWPVHFALLNNDCMWVMDEVQLMGVGVETSSQLDMFRKRTQFETYGNSKTIWMSATVNEDQLKTVDRESDQLERIGLTNEDINSPQLSKRNNAKKSLQGPLMTLTKENSKADYHKELANAILEKHENEGGELTLVIVNTVKRAQAIYKSILEKGRDPENTSLLHSRFREPERTESMDIFKREGDRMIISTQVVEAGVDISAKVLITEIAPWPSLVQRFGRCNRKGEYEDASVFWIDMDDECSPPYEVSDIEISRQKLGELQDVGHSNLKTVEYSNPEVVRPVIRRKDVVELFDTTPDLTGNDIDISRYIREGKERDVQVFWRDISESPSKDVLAPSRSELCSVPVHEINDFSKKNTVWIWDHLDEKWIQVKGDARPGTIIMVDLKSGGYRKDMGWIGKKWKKSDGAVEPIPADTIVSKKNESTNSEVYSVIGSWITISQHCNDVKEYVEYISEKIGIEDRNIINAISKAGLWHDVGKAHPAFQNGILNKASTPPKTELWAKTDRPDGWIRYFTIAPNDNGEEVRKYRKYFRHELASALAWLQKHKGSDIYSDLTAYLIVAHHGKVRQSIRSIPDETEPDESNILFARGVWHGDVLPNVSGIMPDSLQLDLRFMELGEGSWLERSLSVLEMFGPYKLAYLESLLRVSDWNVSRSYNKGVSN